MRILTTLFFASVGIQACSSNNNNNSTSTTGGSTGGATGNGTGNSTGNSTSSGAWKQMDLKSGSADHTSDRVSSIYYISATQGLVTTVNEDGDGGALFNANATAVTTLALDGSATNGDSDDQEDFLNVFAVKGGYVATMSTSGAYGFSTDGTTFSYASNTSLATQYDLAPVFVMRDDGNGNWIYAGGGSGELATASASSLSALADAAFTENWGPEDTDPVPPEETLASDTCQLAALSNADPTPEDHVYVSPDLTLVAFTVGRQNTDPITIQNYCISTNANAAVPTYSLGTVTPANDANAMANGPEGIMFTSKTNGYIWAGDTDSGSAYIQYTTNGGATWTDGTLPSDVQTGSVDIQQVFFAPDNTTGWAVGWHADPFSPLLIKTTDAGKTWKDAGQQTSLTTAMDANNSAAKLYTGFAIDATHIWVGGENGSLFANVTGGD